MVEPNFAGRDASPKTAKAWEKTEGYSVGYERAEERDVKTCKGSKIAIRRKHIGRGRGICN